jgi:signal transduction histidine kinase/FixJ family two-component response regulator
MNLKSKKILIIEDDPDVRLATRFNLESAGYTNVLEAENGEIGLVRIRDEKPALVLLDRKMPGKDGLQVLDEIKDIYGDDVEVVMLTAYRDKGYITDAMSKGAFDYLVKDEDPDFHLHTIEKALRYHQKSLQRKTTERERYELLIDNNELVKNGYDLEYFKDVIRAKIGDLVEGVIHTAITDCMTCTNRICQFYEDVCLPPQFGAKLLSSALGELPPLFIMHREIGDPFFRQTVRKFVEETRQHEVNTLVYVPIIDYPSSPLLEFLQEKQNTVDFIRYGCIYIFSTKTLKFSPEEKRLLRSFFDRFLIAVRMSKLVTKIDSLNKNRLLGEMAAMIVHQISPLITPLMDCLQAPDAKKQAQGLAMIKDLRGMVDDFREYTNGIVKDYHFASHDLIHVIRQAETLLILQTKQQVTIHHEFPETPQVVYGDAERLRQVFSNLLLNAIQAIATINSPSGRIEIQVINRANWAEVHVRDNGGGVPAEVVPKLFSSYISTKNGGMGLGLCLAHEILRRHGGKIEYNPQYSGGAEFVVTLPLASADSTLGYAI